MTDLEPVPEPTNSQTSAARYRTPPGERPKLDFVGVILSAGGLSLAVLGVLQSGTWGWIQPKPGGTSWANLSPTVWFVLGGELYVAGTNGVQVPLTRCRVAFYSCETETSGCGRTAMPIA